MPNKGSADDTSAKTKQPKKAKSPKTQKAPPKIPNDVYEAEIIRLQTEFVKLQEWVKFSGTRIVVIFEGRDGAGKGGTIKRVTEYLNPRYARIEALPAPTDRERRQWYYQPGVEKVMGFCTQEEYELFLQQTPIFERMLIDDGILLRKYWFSVSEEEQLRRFEARRNDPVRQWKLSPMDLESLYKWEDYSRARDEMMAHTDKSYSPWFLVESDIKKHARLNMISHLLSTIEYHNVKMPKVK